MDIILLNTPQGEVRCYSINDAEIKSMLCTDNVRVKITNSEGVILFDFNPNKENFIGALNYARARMNEQRNSFLNDF